MADRVMRVGGKEPIRKVRYDALMVKWEAAN